MSRSRTTTATRRPPTPTNDGQTNSYLPEEIVEFLTEGGWVHAGDDKPTVLSLWAHETKGGGNPLPAEQAYTVERGARDAAAEQGDASETAEDVQGNAEAQAEAEAARERETAAEDAAIAKAAAERAEVADALRRRIDQAERAAAEAAAAPEPEFLHDGIGAVSIWRCYSCGFETRYTATCDCRTCVGITAAVECPSCGDKQPNMDPRRR